VRVPLEGHSVGRKRDADRRLKLALAASNHTSEGVKDPKVEFALKGEVFCCEHGVLNTMKWEEGKREEKR